MESIGEIIDDHHQTVAEHVVIDSSVTSNSSSSTSPSTIPSPLSQVGPLLSLPAINSLRSNLSSSSSPHNVPNHLHSNNNSVVMLRSAAEYIESQQSHQNLEDITSPHNIYTHHTTMSLPGSSRIIKNHLGNGEPIQNYHHPLDPHDDMEIMKSSHSHLKQHSNDVIVTTITEDMQSPNDVEIMHQQYHSHLHQQQIHNQRNIRHHETISVIVQPNEDCSRDSHGGLMSPQKLTPSSVTSLQSGGGTNDDLDSTTYQTLTSVVNNYNRSSPTNDFSPNSSAYATLTPLQPLPPISTMSDKFAYGHVNNSSNNENNENPNTGYHNYNNSNGSNMQKSPAFSQDHHHSPQKLSVNVNSSSPNPYNYNNEIVIGTTDQFNNGRHNTRQSQQLSPNLNSYATINRVSDLSHMTHLTSSPSPSPQHQTFHSHSHRDTIVINSPSPPLVTTSLQQQQQQKTLSGGNNLNMNGTSIQSNNNKSESLNSSSNSSKQFNTNNNTVVTSSTATSSTSGSDGEEINTKEIAQRISAELKRYSIPQAIFAQRVLCRSQGTLSDLLRNPKPWSKLKSGRETFRRMYKWLQEPEFQRMSALRMAGE